MIAFASLREGFEISNFFLKRIETSLSGYKSTLVRQSPLSRLPAQVNGASGKISANVRSLAASVVSFNKTENANQLQRARGIPSNSSNAKDQHVQVG